MKRLLHGSFDLHCRRLLFILFFSVPASLFGQENSQTVESLLEQRASLINSGEPTPAVDNQLRSLGHRPKAVLTFEALPDGKVHVSCPLYISYTPQNVAGMFPRLSGTYPYLLSLEKSSGGEMLNAIFSAGTTNAQAAEIFNHYGYQGYETHY